MKTALIIGYVWPEPASSAAGSRMLQLIAALQSGGYRVVFGSPADWSPHAVALADYGVEAAKLQLNSSTFNDYIAGLQPDLVMFDRFMMEEQFGWRVEETCPNALRVLDMEDVHSLRHARHQALKEGVEPGLKHIHSELAIREVAAVLRCDLALVISEFELHWLQQQFQIPAAQLIYLPFMLLASQWQRPLTALSQRQHFVCGMPYAGSEKPFGPPFASSCQRRSCTFLVLIRLKKRPACRMNNWVFMSPVGQTMRLRWWILPVSCWPR